MSHLIEMAGISKAFGGSVALRDVSLALEPGTVHALMGENGAGKSTLMKILAGVHQPDSGEIRKAGRTVSFSNPRAALEAGISTVFQELSLLPNMTIAENMFLGREPAGHLGGIDRRRMREETKGALDRLGLTLDPDTLVSELSIAERQFVEIAHGIDADADVFILDEPTAALNVADVAVLNRHIRALRDAGKAIVYISHRMDEIFAICDVVTVLKDGQLIGTRPLSEMMPGSLIAMMVGRELEDLFPERGDGEGAPALSVSDLRLQQDSKPFSFTVRRGEIVGFAGLEGQGQQKALRALVGQFAPVEGVVSRRGETIRLPMAKESGVRRWQALGGAFVPEDRKDEGLFLGHAIGQNIVAALHAGRPPLAAAKRYGALVSETMRRLNVKASGPSVPVGALSGGNQQKVLLGRYLATDADLLLIEEPTRGVDVGAKAEIYRILHDFAQAGGAVIVLSRETVELIGLCDRLYVIHGNTVVSEMQAAVATEHGILDAALSA
ncbi:sugar ABC transporter ATP-binding protein [Shinella zoogloeoides]|uniref:ATP-binding cassette domain-containing protein n=1 Tax=Shinella zoogloeoides TaxID=352475 RepID=A0A6N8TES8_SHIZO|nr:sugar ABC transporter ATP-binding protein [Shinella zoogloeoides]MXN99629.1 ATP-binding cassette domain-containing protein [Shinella zoogloeoides]UEX80873.1 sugar ABC transporter ATP-binding protein [Shinella zoogloeoides]